MTTFGAQQNRPNLHVFTREESLRVQAYLAKVGIGVASKRLGVGADTLENARDQGRMQRKTRDRIFEAIAREEARTP